MRGTPLLLPIALACGCSASGGHSAPREFTPPVAVSATGGAAFVPSIAARADGALLAWHAFDTSGGVAAIEYARIVDGAPLGVIQLTDPLGPALHPSVAATGTGYVIAYAVNDGVTDVIRALWLQANSSATQGPETISAPGAEGTMPRVASAAGETLFAWTDGSTHFFAMRGNETVVASSSGQALISGGILNYPRVALRNDGTALLAWRDGGVDSIDWDVLLSTRAPGGNFGAPVNVSHSSGLLSDDISLAMEPDGTLDVAWVDQSSADVTTFEVDWATVAPNGTATMPARFGTQHDSAWLPSVTPGLDAAWHTGPSGAFGTLWFADGPHPATELFPGTRGGTVALARGPAGELHLAFTDDATPRRVHYSSRP